MVYTRDIQIPYLKKIPVKISRKRRIGVSANWCSNARHINIILEHIVARQIRRIDIAHFGCITDEPVVIVCRGRRRAIYRISRRRRRRLITDMCRTIVCSIRTHHNGGTMHICRVQEANAFPHNFNTRRVDCAHIDNIGFPNRRCSKRVRTVP